MRENYDDLGYPQEGIARDSRYTRYVSRFTLLRTQITASIPILLRALSCDPPGKVLLVCPGLVYRRDVIDRLHVGEPHQLDLWFLKKSKASRDDLARMIELVVKTALPGRTFRVVEARHPYTVDGLQLDIESKGRWIEIGECGLADPRLLQRCGMDPSEVSGLAMGLGLDRLFMLRKQIDDIRFLRSNDPRIQSQMSNLELFRPVSNQPPILRDLSIGVADELDSEQLPCSARERMGIRKGQKNLLVRLVIRHPTRTLTASEANRLRDEVYLRIHEGKRFELTED